MLVATAATLSAAADSAQSPTVISLDEALQIGEEAKEHKALLEMGHKYLELPLGEGDVNFDVYLPALAATGFNGFLTIEREVGNQPEKDIALAVEFLREKIKKFGLA